MWDANELMEYLADHPPAHVILAARYLKPNPGRKAKQKPTSQFDDLRREIMQSGGGIVRGPLPAIYRDK